MCPSGVVVVLMSGNLCPGQISVALIEWQCASLWGGCGFNECHCVFW